MKRKNFLMVIISMALLVSCNNKNNTDQKEIADLKAQNDTLEKHMSQKDQTINGFLSSLNEIEENLATIKEKEHLISVKTANKNGELKEDVKSKINEDIKDIYGLLIKNKKLIVSLNKKLKTSNMKVDELQKMTDNLNKLVEEKDAEINTLKGQLAKLNIEVKNLNSNVENLTEETKAQQEELNTAYYIMGTKRELEEKKVITKEGGFIGLGRVEELKNTASWASFTKIDITRMTAIPVNKKRAKLITTHPEGSYKIEKDNNDMVKDIAITNPKDFWSVSKYLVVDVR